MGKFKKYFLLAALLFCAVPIFSKVTFEKSIWSTPHEDHEEWTTLVIVLDDEEIGYITYAIDRYDANDSIIPRKQYAKEDNAQCKAYIKYLVIYDGYRKLGLGRELILQAFRDMRDKKCSLVTLLSKGEAIGFYKKIGFTTDAQEVKLFMELFNRNDYMPMRYVFK
jgi:ribosomal protein S18 acetylase RimI-like enzyme